MKAAARRRSAAMLLGLLAAGALAAPAGCSLLVPTTQCSSTADCVAKGSAFANAVCESGSCLIRDAGGGAVVRECTTNLDCTSTRGAAFFCRPSDFTCVSLTAGECSTVRGDYTRKDDTTIFVGVLESATAAGSDIDVGVDLAYDDFKTVGGLPTSGNARPAAYVPCAVSTDPLASARHLVQTVGVPAIISTLSSEATLEVAKEITIPAGVMLVATSATTTALTDLPDDGLVIRTIAGDDVQGRALGAAFAGAETDAKAAAGVSTITAALVSSEDDFGTAIATAAEATMVLNGLPATANGARYERITYPRANPDFETLAGSLTAFAPNVVVVAGGAEAAQLVTKIESKWPGGATRPYYVLADRVLGADLLAATLADGALRVRIRGTAAGRLIDSPAASSALRAFAVRFRGRQPNGDPATGAANAYDAAYVVAYSIIASRNKPLTGRTLADQALSRLVGGARHLGVGTADFQQASTVLLADFPIDLEGLASPLDFTRSGDVGSEIDVWCLSSSAGKVVRTSARQRYTLNGALDGTYTSCP